MHCLLFLPDVSQLPWQVAFLIDTGAEVTALNPETSRRLSLPDGLFRGHAVTIEGIGGQVRYYPTDNAFLIFNDGTPMGFCRRVQLYLGPPDTPGWGHPVLGMDILRRMRLSVDATHGLVQLDPAP